MKSEWMKNRHDKMKQLNQNIECDVLIVGAGMSGLLCAYQLQHKFDRVVIIESDEIASGASGRNTGKLTSQHGFNYQKILNFHGIEKTRLYYEENEQAIQGIKKIIDEYAIECDYQMKDSIVGCKSSSMKKKVIDEISAYNACGILYESVGQGEVEGILVGARFKKQASFDPYQFCIQLAQNLNVEIYEKTPMMKIHEHIVETQTYQIGYKHCILATQVLPFQFRFFYALTKPKQSFLAALKPSMNSHEMVLSEDEITRTRNDMSDFTLIGGYDHDLSDDSDLKWQKFKQDLVLEYPKVKVLSTWSSQDYEVFDFLPIIDTCDDFIVITGFNKWGNTNAYVASKVVQEIVCDEQSALRELFTYKRKSLVLNKKIVSENFQVLKNLVESKMDASQLAIPDEQTSVSFQVNHHPYGIYREKDVLYIVDILCPHLGCTLKFNEHDKCWDCPCHGSRFTIEGEIIKGPASVRLHHSKTTLHELKSRQIK